MSNQIKKVGIVACSNGQKEEYVPQIEELECTLRDMGLQPVFSDFLYECENVFSGTTKERADALMQFYKDEEITEIFDISGGDIANGILPHLDYDVIAKADKRFWGYSDLTTIVNAIYAKTGNPAVLYQVKNLIWDESGQQKENFRYTVTQGKDDLFRLDYHFIQGKEMHGVVVGGNIRCFLKLAGTEYMPDLSHKILLLESLGGGVPKMEAALCQLHQLGAFDKVAGIILGTFTMMERQQYVPTIETLLKRIAGNDLPIAVTKEVGHGTDSKAVMIGKTLELHADYT